LVNGKISAWLNLIRVPNLFTALADILGGFLYVGGHVDQAGQLAILAFASLCLYAGGVALNDVVDTARDAAERPHRPIPSGLISRPSASLVSFALLFMGGAAALAASTRSGAIAVFLVGAILLYDVVLKTTVVASGLMGVCRALNLLLGMSLAPALALPHIIVPCTSLFVYVTSITHLGRQEARDSLPPRSRLWGLGGAVVGINGLWLLLVVTPGASWGYLRSATATTMAVAVAATCAAVAREPADKQRAMKWLVLLIIGFDAGLAGSTRGLVGEVLVAFLLVPAIWLSRRLRVT